MFFFHKCSASQHASRSMDTRTNQIVLQKNLHCKEVESPCSKLSKQWEFFNFERGPSPSSDSQSFLQWVWYSGVLYEICVHIRYAKWLSWGGFQLSSNLKTNRSIFVWIWILFMYWSRGLFLWMVQRKSPFWDLKRVDGTTQVFVSGTFSSVNSKAAYWPNISSWSINYAAAHT